MESDAYTQGSLAYSNMEGIEHNPYDEADAQHDEWEQGWIEAEMEDEVGDEDDGA